MKGNRKEIIIILLIELVIYISPMFIEKIGETNILIVNLSTTFILSLVLGMISKHELKFIYPFLIGILFIPSVYLYYDNTALVQAFWYFVASITGMGLGTSILLLK